MRGRVARLAMVLAAATGVAACGDTDGETADGRIRVVATTTQVSDLARAVAGRRAAVAQILDAGADPHDYEPRPSDARDLADATLVLRSGGEVDGWLRDLLDNAGGHARTVTLLDAVGVRRDRGEVDPHWWQDPRTAARAVQAIAAALARADPSGRATYARNAARYERRLAALDRAVADCMGRVPGRRRRLVTDHDALGYYAQRYDIDVVATVIPALSTEAQASAGELSDLVATIRRTGVSTIFPERGANTRLQRAVAREASATVGPGLYTDALGPAGSPGATYVGSIEANTRALVRGFSAGRVRCAL